MTCLSLLLISVVLLIVSSFLLMKKTKELNECTKRRENDAIAITKHMDKCRNKEYKCV